MVPHQQTRRAHAVGCFWPVFCHIVDTEPTKVLFCQILNKYLRISTTRKRLAFLLSACVSTKNLDDSSAVWREYVFAGLPYGVLTIVSMYQAFAQLFLDDIHDPDP